ncbi:MAG: ATP-binding protein [Bacteroidales bacterium]|nr:ATP-binding protein [Bacteroidales bacterium]
MKNLALILSLLASCVTIFAQSESSQTLSHAETPVFEELNDGLLTRNCIALTEDSDGYIWIATTNGIFRYDGIEYKHFFYDNDADRFQNTIKAICEDKFNNCIWAFHGEKRKLLRIDKKTYHTSELDISSDEMEENQINVMGIYAYNDTLLFCNLQSKPYNFCFIDKRSGETYLKYYGDKKRGSITVMPTLVGNRKFMSVNGDLYEITAENGIDMELRKIDVTGKGLNVITRRFSVNNDSTIITEHSNVKGSVSSSRTQIYSYNINSGKAEHLFNLNGFTNGLACIGNDIWISMQQGGLMQYSIQDNSLHEFTTYNSSVIANRYSTVMTDNYQPILWIATHEGLMKVDYLISKFRITDTRKYSDSYTDDIYATLKDNSETYWFVSRDGLFSKGPNTNLYQRIDNEDIKSIITKNYSVLRILEDKERELLYFHALRGIVRYDIKTRKTNIIKKTNQRIEKCEIMPDGTLLALSDDTFHEIDPNTANTIRSYSYDKALVKKARTFFYDGDSLIWIGNTSSEILTYNRLTGITEFRTRTGTEKNIISHIRQTIHNGEREIWIAAGKDGINFYLPNKQRLTRIEYGQFLSKNINNLEIDGKGNVWATSNKGVVCIDNKNGNVYEFDKYKYDFAQTFRTDAISVTNNGNILLGATNKIIEFNSNITDVNEYFPSPIVTSYRLINAMSLEYEQYTKSISLANTDTLYIPKGIRSLQLFVRILNHSNPKENIIEWRKSPSEDGTEWHMEKTTEPIAFSNFAPGINKIELRSCNQEGIPTNNIKTLYIYNDVFIYEKPLFTLYVIICVIIIFAITLYFRDRQSKQQRKQLEIEVNNQAGQIIKANEELKISQDKVVQQNAELRRYRDHLMQEVEQRTVELDDARKKAEEASKLKSAFLATLSHEVRTPMNCIVGFSKLLDDDTCSDEERKEFIHLIQESSQSMLVLVNDLLDVSRIESGQLRINTADFEVSKEVYDVYKILSVERKNQNVKFNLFASPKLNGRIIHSDKERFRQIIINICYNAFKFTENGYVNLHADIITPDELSRYGCKTIPEDLSAFDLLLCRIEDSGIGIPADKATIIFEPFRKLNNNKTLYPGLGLGLNIVKNLIELLKGQIWLKSHEGQGTTFYFYLPF